MRGVLPRYFLNILRCFFARIFCLQKRLQEHGRGFFKVDRLHVFCRYVNVFNSVFLLTRKNLSFIITVHIFSFFFLYLIFMIVFSYSSSHVLIAFFTIFHTLAPSCNAMAQFFESRSAPV